MSENTNIVTPKGKILYMNLVRAQQEKNKKTGELSEKSFYSLRLSFSNSDPACKALKAEIKQRLGAQFATDIDEGENFMVKFKTQNVPSVILNGQKIEGIDIPHFDGRVDTGNAEAEAYVYTTPKGSGMALVAVALSDLSLTERASRTSELEQRAAAEHALHG